MVEMRLPSMADVNVTRLTRFGDAITAALGDKNQLNAYRDVIAHFVEHHDVLESDITTAGSAARVGDSF